MPEIHAVFFEFKEFIALFTLPMMAVSTFVLWWYGDGIVQDQELGAVASIPVLLGWVYLVLAYVLGAAITKLAGGGDRWQRSRGSSADGRSFGRDSRRGRPSLHLSPP